MNRSQSAPGSSREAVFHTCNACHSLRIVMQQGLGRDSWAETLARMVEEQGMPELEGKDFSLVLDYLAQHYGL